MALAYTKKFGTSWASGSHLTLTTGPGSREGSIFIKQVVYQVWFSIVNFNFGTAGLRGGFLLPTLTIVHAMAQLVVVSTELLNVMGKSNI